MRRAILILLIALALYPGLYLPAGPATQTGRQYAQLLSATPLALAQPEPVRLGAGARAPRLASAWWLRSPNFDFSAYSALTMVGRDRMVAISDRGGWMELSLAAGEPSLVAIGTIPREAGESKSMQDIEAAAYDPVSNRFWFGYEMRNSIYRHHRDYTPDTEAVPAAMKHWGSNSGPEAMTRLADGRFMVIAEGAEGLFTADRPALLFAGDPIERSKFTAFRFNPPFGYSPTELAQLPDGRVLVLLRSAKIGIPPHFSARIVVVDPTEIEAGKALAWQPIATLEDASLPLDNFEGMTVQQEAGGALSIWLISDDNQMLLQRTLLLRLLWNPAGS